MKPGVLLDTGFWIALLDRRDDNHRVAKAGIGLVLNGYRPFVSDFVIFETLTYLNCSLGRHDLAVRFLGKTELAGLNVIEVDKRTKAEAIALFRRYSDKDFSVTDCTSFVLMDSHRIRHFAGFDAHFTQMGFAAALAA